MNFKYFTICFNKNYSSFACFWFQMVLRFGRKQNENYQNKWKIFGGYVTEFTKVKMRKEKKILVEQESY